LALHYELADKIAHIEQIVEGLGTTLARSASIDGDGNLEHIMNDPRRIQLAPEVVASLSCRYAFQALSGLKTWVEGGAIDLIEQFYSLTDLYQDSIQTTE